MKKIAILIFMIYSLSLISEIEKESNLKVYDNDGNYIVDLDVEIADTDRKRAIGLMYEKEMDFRQGMLFIFPNEEIRSFWMKNTYIPLDIIFCDSSGRIAHIAKDTTPLSDKSIPSLKPAKYVLEVRAGFTDEFEISEGFYIEF